MRISQYLSPRRWAENLYDNTQELARSPWALGLCFLLELIGCTLVPVPIEVVLMALVGATPRRWLRFVLSAALGSIVGGVLLYSIGHLFFESVGEPMIAFYGAESQWVRVVHWFRGGWGVSFMLMAYSTTGFFRVASLGAGFAGVNPLLFIALLVVTRCARFSAEGMIIKYLGERYRNMVKRYYGYAAMAIALGFVIIIVVAKLAA